MCSQRIIRYLATERPGMVVPHAMLSPSPVVGAQPCSIKFLAFSQKGFRHISDPAVERPELSNGAIEASFSMSQQHSRLL